MDRIDSRALRVATRGLNAIAAVAGVVCVFDFVHDTEWLARGAGRPVWEQPWYPFVVTAAMFVLVQALAALATGDSIRATPGDPNASVLGRAWLGSQVRVIQHGRLAMAAASARAENDPPVFSKTDPPEALTMYRHARCPEEAMPDLPPVVQAG